MNTTTLGRCIGSGVLAGAAAGLIGAAAMYWLVEPSIRAAIAIEEAGHSHDDADPVVSRGAQVVGGLVTVLVVGVLIGIAFALTHRLLRARLPGRTATETAMTLAALGFVASTLAPAVVLPANPPAVGDPGTVNLRTITYLSTIVCAVALTAAVVAVARSSRIAAPRRLPAAAVLAITGTGLLLWALPNAADPVPANIPADLLWQFRIGSLAQIGLMWVVLGTVFGLVAQRAEEQVREVRRSRRRSIAH